MSLTSKLEATLPNMSNNAKVADLERDIVEIGKYNIKGQTTDFGSAVSNTDTWLKVSNNGTTGPSLLEDPISGKKIHRFDHERIPERVVHACGAGAHGYFSTHTLIIFYAAVIHSYVEVYDSRAPDYTFAKVLTDPSRHTPVFVRFSTVQGPRGIAVSLSHGLKAFSNW